MELNKNKFAFSAASVMGIWYLVCAFIVAVAPQLGATLFSWMVHLVNLETTSITWGTFFAGLVEILILSYLTGWVFAWIHNRSMR
jgi:hypothetical protein